LILCRYIERNALRAGLVERAEDWRWSGVYHRSRGTDGWLTSTWPVPRPSNWIELVNQPLTDSELHDVRSCIRRGSPLGTPEWTRQTAEELGLRHTLRPPGRPAKIKRR
jgi:putative transposase